MGFRIPATIPRPTEQELEDPDLLHAYFEKNFATTPQLKEELEELTDSFCFDSYESFTQHLSGRGITYESPSWTGRAGGSGVYGSPQAWTERDTQVTPVEVSVPEPIPSTPFATPQMALDGLKKNLTLHYQKTHEGLGQLLEPCERDGSVMLNVPSIVAGGFGIFTQAMTQGREDALAGLKNVLESYAGMMGPERDSAAEALYHFYERVFTTALGPEWQKSAEFKDYVTQFKAEGHGSVPVLGVDPFTKIEISTYDFTYSLFQEYPEALLELGKVKESRTFDLIDTKVNDQMVRVSRTLTEIAAIKTPDHLYDLIHNFANYGPARKYIYDYLGITEDRVIQGQTQVGGTKRVRDPYDPKGYMLESVPDRKPNGMDDQTWNLVKCLAQRKTTIERGETAFFVLSIGGSILAGIAGGVAAGVLSGGNPVVIGYAASATAMAAAGMIGTHMVNGSLQEREWGGAGQAAAVFSGVPLGSNEMVTFLDEKVRYTVVAAAGNVVLAGVGAGAATKITMLLEGQIVKRIAVQALYGALDGTASVAIDDNVNNQERLTQATVLAGGKAEDAPTVTQVFFTAAVLGGVIGGTAEAVFNPGEMKIALELATGKLKFYDAAGKPIPVKACAKVQGGVYKVTNTNGEVAYFRVNDQAAGAAVTQSKVATQKPGPVKPKEKSTAPADTSVVAVRRPATQEDVQAYLAAHPELKSQNIPDDVLAAAILRYLNNPEQEFGIGAFNTGHEFQDGADAAHAATTPLGGDEGYSAAEADFFGYESSAHFHGGKTSLDERMLQTTGREFDDDLQFLAARARVHHQYNLNNVDNPHASILPTTLTHEIFGVGADGQIAKLTVTASYDPERDAVRFAIDGVNVGEGMVKQVRARGLEVDNEVRAMPPGHLEQMAGQEAASVYDRRLSTQLQALMPMPAGLKQQLENLAPGESVTIGRDFPIDGVDLNRTVEVAGGGVGCPVSRKHLQIRKNDDGTFTFINISKAGTLIRKTDGTVYHAFVADDATKQPAYYIKNLKTGETQKNHEISLGAGDEIIFPNGERFVFEPLVVTPKMRGDIPQTPSQQFQENLLSIMDDPRVSTPLGRMSQFGISGLDHSSVQNRHAHISFQNGCYRMKTVGGAPVLIKRGDQIFDVATVVDGDFILQPGDIIQLGEAPPFVFEYPFNTTHRYLAQNKLPITGGAILTQPTSVDITDQFDDGLRMLMHAESRGDHKPMVVQIAVDPSLADNPARLSVLIAQCQTLTKNYPQIFGFEVITPHTGTAAKSLHFGLNPHYGAMKSAAPVPVRRAPQPPPPPKAQERASLPHSRVSSSQDYITGRLNVGDEVYAPRGKGQVAERGWKITAIDVAAQEVTIEKEFRAPDGRPMLMQKTIPAKDVAPPRAVEVNQTRNIDFVPKGEGFNHIRSRGIYLRRYGVMDEATYSHLFRGNFAQQNVGNCYLISAFNSLRTNEATFEALVRTSLAVPGGKSFKPDGSISDTILGPGHYQVRVPFGQLKGDVIDVFDHELRSQWNKKFLTTEESSGRDLRPTLSPVEGPKGFQILEAVYIKLANQGILDRSAVEGGFSASALKKMFGENVHRRQYGVYHHKTKALSDPSNAHHRDQVRSYLLSFNNQKDICSVASRPNPGKSGHSDSYKVGKFRIYMSHSYSVESVTYGPGATPSTKVITGITVVNPWDTSKKMLMTEAEFMEAFAMIDAVRIDMKNMFDEAKPINPD